MAQGPSILKSKWPSLWIALAYALVGTWFFHVHESLPAAVRAPTSLLLAPIVIVDGACYYLGLPGIYGKNAFMLVAMLAFGRPIAEVVRRGASGRYGCNNGT